MLESFQFVCRSEQDDLIAPLLFTWIYLFFWVTGCRFLGRELSFNNSAIRCAAVSCRVPNSFSMTTYGGFHGLPRSLSDVLNRKDRGTRESSLRCWQTQMCRRLRVQIQCLHFLSFHTLLTRVQTRSNKVGNENALSLVPAILVEMLV